jgi:hypothetical protein
MKALTSALALMLALPVAAQADAPPAAADLLALYGCETARFTAVRNAAGDVLYWNNPTCIPVEGPSDLEAAAAAEAARPLQPTPVAATPEPAPEADTDVETTDKHI